MQYGAEFSLSHAEREAVIDLLKKYTSIQAAKKIDATSLFHCLLNDQAEKNDKVYCLPSTGAHELLQMLLDACPDLARACGFRPKDQSGPAEPYRPQATPLNSACSKVLEGLGYALPR